MGDMADNFNAMKQYNREKRAKIEPQRVQYAIDKLHNSGHRMDRTLDDTKYLVDDYIDFWPYTGWWSGKGIGSGRGIHELIKKLGKSHD